ncbi:MAG: hypothetical protein QOH70_2204 [Blastocatellia bacterium]|jgi:hypothetical protein|nr:hypothetical protein [Blastocatellia bacterium]
MRFTNYGRKLRSITSGTMLSLRHVTVVIVLSFSFFALEAQADSSTTPQEISSQDLTVISLDIPRDELLSEPGEKPYRVGHKLYVKVKVRNDSDQQVKLRVVDPYYQNRPQLFKNGKLMPYRTKIAELIRSKDADPQFVSLRHSTFLMPYSSVDLRELDLNDWYGPLEPGSYRLMNRCRLNIHGPWTADSAPVFFQVEKQ